MKARGSGITLVCSHSYCSRNTSQSFLYECNPVLQSHLFSKLGMAAVMHLLLQSLRGLRGLKISSCSTHTSVSLNAFVFVTKRVRLVF